MSFENLQFIGWDCEGINEGMIDEWTERQKLVLISVSTGDYLYNDEGISQKARLEFIARIARRYPSNEFKHVFFGGSYDFNKILEGLSPDELKRLHEAKNEWICYRSNWLLRYRPRKELTIAHLLNEWDPKEKASKQWDAYIRFWDVIGFFQSSFLEVVKKWLGKDYEDYELIAAGKLARLHFQGSDREFIIEYNKAETKALVRIMEILHEQFLKLDLRVARWDGAGAVATQVFRKYGLKDSYFQHDGNRSVKIELDPEIETACQYGYFGGRIESGFIGHYRGDVYNYDINSAYPFAASQLPNFNRGRWLHHVRSLSEDDCQSFSPFSIYRVHWYFHFPRNYYPFPFRGSDGSVIFPREGERWIFAPELKAAIPSLQKHDKLSIKECWEFIPETLTENTFQILSILYEERQKLIERKDPAEKVLKLGLNSIYGKLCQKLGWDEVNRKSPAFHFLFFAGWITSFTRAKIYSVVWQAQNDVIAINTDGLVSIRELPVRIDASKTFGGWSLEKADELLQLQSGVYWIRRGEKWEERARGLGRVQGEGSTPSERDQNRNQKIIERVNRILQGWTDRKPKIFFPVKQFITSKKSLISDEWFNRWGHWYIMHDSHTGEIGRGLELECMSWGKRRLDQRPEPNKLTPTVASENIEWNGENDLGARYNLPWLTAIDEFSEADESEDLVAL